MSRCAALCECTRRRTNHSVLNARRELIPAETGSRRVDTKAVRQLEQELSELMQIYLQTVTVAVEIVLHKAHHVNM